MPSSAERVKIKRLRTKLERVKMKRDIFIKSRDQQTLWPRYLPTASVMSHYQFIRTNLSFGPCRYSAGWWL